MRANQAGTVEYHHYKISGICFFLSLLEGVNKGGHFLGQGLVSGGRGSLGLSPILLPLALFTLTASPLILARILITPTFPAGSLFLVFSFQKSFLMGKNWKQFYEGKEMTISNYLCMFTYIFTLNIYREKILHQVK